MARVTGPLMSIDASGTVAGAIVFSKWRGRNYVRRHAVPANPRLPAQLAVRGIMGFLANQWASLGDPLHSTWEEPADARKISAFNQYCAFNSRNYRDLIPPSQGFPPVRAQTPSEVSSITPTVNGRQVAIEIVLITAVNQWGVVVCRAASDGTPANLMMAVHIVPVAGVTMTYVDGPLAPGTYFYNAIPITKDGVAGTPISWEEVSVS